MSPVKVSCPACGGPLIFNVGSAIVAVCPYCRSVVARGDRQLESLGKVAELVETDSVLQVGLSGRYQGVPFTLTGRTQLGHQAGGVWDEWYAAFSDGRWGWLAEAQGRFYLTFERPASAEVVPAFKQLRLGQGVTLPGLPELLVAEKGQARAVSAEGEIPFRLEPGLTYAYADLSGPEDEFATLDYSEEPALVFVGREVTLDDLGVPPTVRPREGRQVEGVQLACPQCGGPLALRAPDRADRAERVTCPNCGALLDVNQGELRFLKALEPGPVQPLIPLGASGQLRGQRFVTIGFMRRSVKIGGVRYFWEEYLLYHERAGFRWLVHSDYHWSYVEPLAPGNVRVGGRAAYLDGKHFRIFQKAVARVENVLGEFYWKVAVGEQVQFTDYIKPPEMLSGEITQQRDSRFEVEYGVDDFGEGEINWSRGTYLPPAEVETAFGLKRLRRPVLPNVAPNQPFPSKGIYLSWGLLSAGAALLGLIFAIASPRRQVFAHTFLLTPGQETEPVQVVFTDPFELHGRHNVQVQTRANVDNTWVDVEGDLIDDSTGLVQTFSTPVSYYHGVDGGESWSEGSQETTIHLSALPAGTYRLRLEFTREKRDVPVSVEVRVVQGVSRGLNLVLALVALAVIPLGVVAYHFYFVKCRWQDSPYSPFHTS
jgi:uncharacterized protein DUF4178